MLEDIEKHLERFATKSFSDSNSDYYFGKTKHDVDLGALTRGLSIPMRDFILRGGKRLRPLLFCTCLQSFSLNYKKYLDIAVLIEVVHNATLVLDDIEDNGKVRRGKPSVHESFGLDTAVNVGFAMHILPLKLLINNGKVLTNSQKDRLWKVYAEELINVSGGQTIDIYWHKMIPDNVTENKYLEMVRLKTGSLMRMSFRMACVVANKSIKEEILYKNFAESLGMAFQIKDDILDLRATDKKFGKAYGNDISEGKLSLPVVYTLQSVSKKRRNELQSILKMHTRNKKHIRKALSIIEESSSIEKAGNFAERLVNEAWRTLVKKKSKDDNLDKMKDLTYYLIRRKY